ncbi:hypothetical protein CC86DRAFT_367058 [Ophiobolus disseminans]|uniref:F-box domain-containing protein n=1 Tax=Ophiobolus disseminans TaxID=1469910 RepID=A0A6A7AEU1_9PLEO|nr:hypothetical protein CC86DRAFT_367058 [Ophiobolus disseminans]
MPTLLALPKELLLHILSFLTLPLIEIVAQTYNKNITATCMSLLQPLLTRRRHIKTLTAQFGPFNPPQQFEFEILTQETERFGLGKPRWGRLREPSGSDVLTAMEYLLHNFTGNLKWLEATKPQNEQNRAGSSTRKNYQALSQLEMAALEAEASTLGLKLPAAFIKLFTNANLMHHVPAIYDTSLRISSGLNRVPAVIDSGAGGYCIPMREEMFGDSAWSLYLAPDGTHCVLETTYDTGRSWEDVLSANGPGPSSLAATEEEMQEAKNEGREMAVMLSGGVLLEGVGFEEWLALMCFENGVSLACCDMEEVGEGLKEYVRTVYVG